MDWCNRAPPAFHEQHPKQRNCSALTFQFKRACFLRPDAAAGSIYYEESRDAASEGSYQIAACVRAVLPLSHRTTKTVCGHQRPLSVRANPSWKQDEPCCGFFFLYLWLRGGGRRRGRFTRQHPLLLKRMQAGMCLMIHRSAMPQKPKWVWRICSTLLKQTRRTVIDENDERQPACARGVLARAKERPSLIKHARLENNAVGFFFC